MESNRFQLDALFMVNAIRVHARVLTNLIVLRRKADLETNKANTLSTSNRNFISQFVAFVRFNHRRAASEKQIIMV